MFAIGLILLAAAVVAGVELILGNRQGVTLHMWNGNWHFDAFWLAVAGAIIITVAWLGLAAMRAGMAHSVRLRRERRNLARENRELAARAASTEAAPVGAGATERGARVADNRNVAQPVTSAANGSTAVEEPAVANGGRRHLFGRHQAAADR